MTLRRKMATHTGVMIAGVILIGLGTVLGVTLLRQDLGVALDANALLRGGYEVGFQIAQAKQWLNLDPPRRDRAGAALNTAIVRLEERNDGWAAGTLPDDIRVAVRAARAEVGRDEATAMRHIDAALADLARMSADARRTIVDRQAAADAKHRGILAFVIVLSAVVVIVTVLAGVRQYRGVLTPLGRLLDAVKRAAGGQLDQRLPRERDAEFAELADNFNDMATRLDDIHRGLERRVAEKSKELVRSERLASVGYLAAGVAHEINNPLAIIAGYGERSLRHLRNDENRDADGAVDPAIAERIESSLKVICDEAFRAKDITDRLLSLARPAAAEARGPVCLGAVADDVAATLTGLAKFADRKLTVTRDESNGAGMHAAATTVAGSAGELKQVLLNLLVNALEATKPESGEVRVDVRRDDEWVELRVTDNGRGMTPATLDRVFEPFYSENRGGERPGTGLGLSITHAIVADHRGSIAATSDGPGRGCTFIVRLPVSGSPSSAAEADRTVTARNARRA